ncbi:uncharacterized protein LOC109840352 isoform X4 [Asparagus officinalis]|uniref:uncharacterized protein LOC109840352 isoform X4 n=1 Tax=Asparagus officinalis TaxID=4686 RepID=UPI00098E3F68|nr:uncharacterized protein LOC109840352 isoform X4 [Asparagus officinalis]
MAEEEPISSRGFSVLNRQRFDDLWRKRSLSRVFCPKSSKIRRSMVREELISSDFKVNSPILKFPSLDPWWGSTSKKIKVGKDFEEQRDAMLSEYFYMELYST